MAKPKRMISEWEVGSGHDRNHSARINRVLQLAGLSALGIQGKAADLDASSLNNFLLADTTGDSVSAAAERAIAWRGLVLETPSSVTPSVNEAEKAFRAHLSQDSILPGPDFGAGMDKVLHFMADTSHCIPLGGRLVPPTEIVSYLGFKVELLSGGNEGPQAIVYCGRRRDRYVSKVPPPDRLRNARCPVESAVTITVRHLVIFARLLADTLKNSGGNQKSENAEAAPTAPASTLGRPDTTSELANTDSHQGTRNTPKGNPNLQFSASSSVEESASFPVSGDPFDAYLGSQTSSRRAA